MFKQEIATPQAPAGPHPIQTEPGSGVSTRVSDPYAALVQTWRSKSGVSTLGVCGSERRDGGSMVATSMAISSASLLDLHLLLIDANVRHPSLHRTFRLKQKQGLTEVLAGQAEAVECIQLTGISGLSVLTAGTRRQAKWCHTDRVDGLLHELRTDYDLIVVDLPSAEQMTAALHIAGALEGTLLVVHSEKTRIRQALNAKGRLIQVGANVIGTVLNKKRRHLPAWLDKWF